LEESASLQETNWPTVLRKIVNQATTASIAAKNGFSAFE